MRSARQLKMKKNNVKSCFMDATGMRRGSSVARGFTLVLVLSVLVLLVFITIGMLGLSGTSLRQTQQTAAQSQARANAKMSLIIALGELQKQAGLDTRVTASADLLDATHPPVLGVWRSWEGSDHDAGSFAGRPIAPDYTTKRRPSSRNGRFLSWLVSSNPRDNGMAAANVVARNAPFSNSVPMLSAGTLAAGDNRQVHVAPTSISNNGAFAWWVSGENQKALLPKPHGATEETAARWSVMTKSHAIADPKTFDWEQLLTNPAPATKAISRQSADCFSAPANKRAGQYFLDVSAESTGLLTNTATGGWRKDLSLLSELWSQQSGNLPLFRINATRTSFAAIPSSADPYPLSSMIYPWAAYRGQQGVVPIYRHGAVSSWENLIDHMTSYKRVIAQSSGRTMMNCQSVAIDNNANHFGFIHRVRILPVIARMQWVFSHSAAPAASGGGLLEPRLLLTPVITMWNPYNVEITTPAAFSFSIPRPLPAALRYTINGVTNPSFNSVMEANNHQPSLGTGIMRFAINSTFTLRPGETRLFSPDSTIPAALTASINLAPGYRSGGGHFFPVRGASGQTLALPASTTLRCEARFDATYVDGALINPEGVGIYLDMLIGGARHLVYRMIYTPDTANAVYPPLRNLAEGTLGQCVSNPQPFLSTIFGARSASRTHLAAKGLLQSSPLVNYTAMGRKDEAERTIARHYGGTGHPVNSPFDYSFVRHAPGGDSLLPNASDTTGRGYIVTGFNKAEGLSRCVIAEVPTRPLASLAELTHWDLRYENPIPPFALNLIGNSDATPLLPSNAVINVADAGLAENLQYDDSYCANHLLFDDWFLSAITPDPTNFGSAGRSLQATYIDFLTGKTPLAHRSYKPILSDQLAAAQSSGAQQIYSTSVARSSSWQTIASRLDVEGMFNVNSTSVKAWRALLGHARNQRVPSIRESGASWQIGLSGQSQHPLNRFSVAGDVQAGTMGSSGAFPEATEFAGYRVVDETFLDALAEQVVAQIRRRGPFLSLSEFINRQLSTGDLALAGTLQAALNEVAKNSRTNPYAAMQSLSTVASPTPERAADAEYKFPAAAAGCSAFGLPGWTRQADLLRPLAPILSARDDTFTIRSYGDARDGSGRVIARAYCEAVVRRIRDFLDPADLADTVNQPARPINRAMGRRYRISSFRWLHSNEI
jgi:hypothetical protein